MPGFDGTGPSGRGPMTGGARGFCAPGAIGYGRRGRWNTGFGRFRRAGYGRGWNGPTLADMGGAAFSSVDDLADQIQQLSERLDALNARLDASQGRES